MKHRVASAARHKPVAASPLAIPALALATSGVVTVEFIVVGLLPSLARDLGVSLVRAGWLISAFAVSAGLLGPLGALVAQRWAPRRVLSACLASFAVASLAAAVIPDFSVLLATRVLQGALLRVFVSLASAEAAALTGPERAGRAVGQVNLGVVAATVFLVPLGVVLADSFGWQRVFAGLGVAIGIAAAFVAATLPEGSAQSAASTRAQAAILRAPRFLTQLLLSALLFTAMFAAYSYIAAYLETVFRLTGPPLAAVLLGFGLAGLAGNWLAMRVVDRNPLRLTQIVALSLIAATGALSLTGENGLLAILPIAAWGAAHMAAFVACQVRVMFAAPAAPAFAAALNIAVCNLGVAAGAMIGGWVIVLFGPSAIWLGPAALGGIALLLGHALSSGFRTVSEGNG